MRALDLGLVAVIVVGACGGGKAAPAKPADVQACEAATAGIGKREKLDDAHRKAVAARCREDTWSDDAKACLAKAQTKDAADRCANTTLTVGQLEEIDRVMGRAQPEVDKPAVEPSDPSLTVTEISPSRGDAEGGTYVVVMGGGFTEKSREAKVYFGSKEAEIVRTTEDSMIVRSPVGKANETVDVKVVFQPGGTRLLKAAFKYNPARKDGWDD